MTKTMKIKKVSIIPFIAITILSVALSSCRSAGPTNLVRDRSGYINAISDSWKNQLLLNIVKLRYADAPVFLDISSIVNSYETKGELDVKTGWQNGIGFIPGIGSAASFSDKPTISYTPLQGSKFAMSMMNPIGPATVMGLIYSGFPVDMTLRLMVASINGICNSYSGPLRKREASHDFFPLLDCLKKIQDVDGLFISRDKKNEGVLDLYLKTPADPSSLKNVSTIKSILGISDTAKSYTINYGWHKADSFEIVLNTRSFLEILTEIASTVQVPQEHLTSNQAFPANGLKEADGREVQPFINILSSTGVPKNAFFSIQYNGYWYYIDKRDFNSKRAFSFLLMLSSLNDTDDQKGSPVLTIPVN